MAAGTIAVFNTSKEWLMDGTFDLDGDSFKIMLITAATVPAVTDVTPDPTNYTEVTAGGNYTAGGAAATVTWVESAGTVTLALSANVAWLANGANPTNARYAILFADNVTTPVADAAVAFIDLGATIDMSAGDLTINAGNIFTLA